MDCDRPPVTWEFAPCRCELLSAGEQEALLPRLGPDPVRDDDPTFAFARISGSERPIGELLLDAPAGLARDSIDQSEGRFVYKQDWCRGCGANIRSWRPGNRVPYAREACQPVA